MRHYTNGVLFLAKFCLDRCILSSLRAKKITSIPPYLTKRSILRGPIPTLFVDQGEILRARVDLYLYSTLSCQILSESVYYGESPKFYHIFQLEHSVVAPHSGIETKLNANAQQQTFPYPSIKRIFILERLHGEVVSTNSTV